MKLSPEQLGKILSAAAVRERSHLVLERCKAGQGLFEFQAQKLSSVSNFVMQVTRDNYPTLEVPYHSRLRHFQVGGVDRLARLRESLSEPNEWPYALIDLVVTSVLLDAGSGPGWQYHESSTGKRWARSEGLAVASLDLFLSGKMSSDGRSLRADRSALVKFSKEILERGFQVSSTNPLAGVEGRVQLLNSLGRALENQTYFPNGRPSGWIDFVKREFGLRVKAEDLLKVVLQSLGGIWPGRLKSNGQGLGDVWNFPPFGSSSEFEALLPFHKLSQWLTYSLLESFEFAGIEVVETEGLTGLAEYRNGGLMLDSGLITLKNPSMATQVWPVDSELILEWRGLTVALLDLIGRELGLALPRVLEGGTWWAGRRLAEKARPGGGPPFQIASDGTVF